MATFLHQVIDCGHGLDVGFGEQAHPALVFFWPDAGKLALPKPDERHRDTKDFAYFPNGVVFFFDGILFHVFLPGKVLLTNKKGLLVSVQNTLLVPFLLLARFTQAFFQLNIGVFRVKMHGPAVFRCCFFTHEVAKLSGRIVCNNDFIDSSAFCWVSIDHPPCRNPRNVVAAVDVVKKIVGRVVVLGI